MHWEKKERDGPLTCACEYKVINCRAPIYTSKVHKWANQIIKKIKSQKIVHINNGITW